MSDAFEKKFFAELLCPVGAWVGHAIEGQGTVIASDFSERTVTFEYHEVKRPHELSAQELAELHIEDPSTLISVDWISSVNKVVVVSELTFLGIAENKYARWSKSKSS